MGRRSGAFVFLGAIVLSATAPAWAEPTAVMPPRPVSEQTVPYPAGASGDATVVLELLVSAEGTVDEARLLRGDDPFASAAATAARAWTFTPSTHEGRAIAARIRVDVQFRVPNEAAKGAPPPPTLPSVPIQEVNVHGNKIPPGAMSLGRAEVRQLPGAFGDPFRAIDALPGVTPIASGLPFFYVRGAPPGNVGYFLDGVKVPYLFHVGAGPSVVHPGLVSHVDLYPGGYPARYGRFAGAIVAAETNDPRPVLHAEGNARLFDVGALAETGFADGKGTALVGGRYSYTAAILSLIAKDTTLDYRDYQARVSYDLSPKDRVSLLMFGSYDLLSQTVNGIDSVIFGSEFYRADLRYDRAVSEDTTLRVATTLGFDQSRIPGQPRNSQNASGGARLEVKHRSSRQVTIEGGLNGLVEHYTADARPYSDPDDPDTQRFNALFPARSDTTVGAWAQAVLTLPRLQITPGLRFDLFSSAGATAPAVDPRIASRIDVAPKVHILHAFGLAHQPPSYVIPIPGLAIGNLKGGLQQSIQASAGVEVDLPEEMTATLTVFDDVFQNMSDTLGVSQGRDPADNVNREPRSLGSSTGVELYVRRKLTKRLGGFLSYTLSRSVREVGRERFLSAFDRPHVANAALAYDLGRSWRAGTRFTIYSGTPVIPPGGNGLIPPPRSLSPDRDPAFYRLDLRLEKRWNLGPKSWIAFVAEVMNATLHKEIVLSQTIGPVTIPSIGLEGAFE